MKQTEKILAYLDRYGSITPLEAMRDLDIYRLAARISDLRHMGYNIVRDLETHTNRMGELKTYARYRMEEKKDV